MPRNGRGGPRRGAPGVTYAQRSDLNEKPRQPIQAPTAQQYGDRTRNEEAQRVAPLPGTPEISTGGAGQAWAPPALPALSAPTAHPDRPVTHGLSLGEGAGPQTPDVEADDFLPFLRATYARHPSPELLKIILDEMSPDDL